MPKSRARRPHGDRARPDRHRPRGQAGRFNQLLREQLPLLREYEGLRYVKLARRMQGNSEQVVLFEEWIGAQALYRWTGPELTKGRLVPGAEELIDDLVITHHEALDMDPPDGWPGLRAIEQGTYHVGDDRPQEKAPPTEGDGAGVR